MTNYTDEQVAEACAVLSKDSDSRRTLVEMWAGKRKSVFKGAVHRLARALNGDTGGSEDGATGIVAFHGERSRIKIMLHCVPKKDTFGMVKLTVLWLESERETNNADIRQNWVEHAKFEEELGQAFPSDQLVAQLFMMKEFA